MFSSFMEQLEEEINGWYRNNGPKRPDSAISLITAARPTATLSLSQGAAGGTLFLRVQSYHFPDGPPTPAFSRMPC